MARAADTAEVEQTALLSPKKLKDHPPRIAPLRKTAQRAGLSTKVYAAITLVLALTAFLFGRLNAPQANRVGDVASVASATDDGVRLTKDEVKALSAPFMLDILHHLPYVEH